MATLTNLYYCVAFGYCTLMGGEIYQGFTKLGLSVSYSVIIASILSLCLLHACIFIEKDVGSTSALALLASVGALIGNQILYKNKCKKKRR